VMLIVSKYRAPLLRVCCYIEVASSPACDVENPMTTEIRAHVPGGEIVGSGSGIGPPVLLLHGGPGLSDYMGSLARELEDGYLVIRYQQRGLAPSLLEGPFDIARHVADAVAVLDAAGITKVFIVGHSWGGHLALHFALTHSERLLGMVVVDPLGGVGDGGEADLSRALLGRLPPGDAARLETLDARSGFLLLWPSYFSPAAPAPPAPEIEVAVVCYGATFDSIHEQLLSGTLERCLPSVAVPTTFVLGADSPVPTSIGIATAELIPGATWEIVAEAGHFVWLEAPGRIRKALDSLI
jgi:proline iminopeptidase